MMESMYYVAALGASSLGVAALRAATTTSATTTTLASVLRFLCRILPLFTLNHLSLFKNFLVHFIVNIYHILVCLSKRKYTSDTKSTLERRDPVGAQCLRPEHFSSLLYGFGMTAFLVLLAF